MIIKIKVVEEGRQFFGSVDCAGSEREVKSAARTDGFVPYASRCVAVDFVYQIMLVSTFITRVQVVFRKKL